MRSIQDAPAPVRERLPVSAKFIWFSLVVWGDLTQREVIERTAISERAVRNSLKKLEETGCIDVVEDTDDPRQRRYIPRLSVADDENELAAPSPAATFTSLGD
jgi:DNA-binding MarR family transcriptional regulator